MRLALAGLVLCASGCNTTSQLVIGLLTNLSVPSQLTQVSLQAYRNVDVLVDEETWMIGDGATAIELPGTFAYYADHGATPVLDIELDGYVGTSSTPVVTRLAQVQLVSDKRLFYRMALVSACETQGQAQGQPKTCGTGESCIEGTCVSEVVDGKTLPAYDASLGKTVECDSGSGFIDTSTCGSGTCEAVAMSGAGCSADQVCVEGTCYVR